QLFHVGQNGIQLLGQALFFLLAQGQPGQLCHMLDLRFRNHAPHSSGLHNGCMGAYFASSFLTPWSRKRTVSLSCSPSSSRFCTTPRPKCWWNTCVPTA